MVLIVPFVGPSASGIGSYGFVIVRMVLIVLLVSPTNSGVIFRWFPDGCAKSSYGFNGPPLWSIGFRDRSRMVFVWFLEVFIWS